VFCADVLCADVVCADWKAHSEGHSRTLFTDEEKLHQSLALLEEYKQGGARDTPVEELWQAKKIKDAIVHPDTGEKVPMPFRMSGFVPFGVPVVVGLLLPNLSVGCCWLCWWYSLFLCDAPM
jgi:sideroflexin-5